MSTVLILALIFAQGAQATHKSDLGERSDDSTPASQVSGFIPFPLGGSGGGKEGGGGGNGDKDHAFKKSGASTTAVNGVPRGVQVIMFATGPKLNSYDPDEHALFLTSEMAKLARKRATGSRVVELPKFRREVLEKSVEDLKLPDGTAVNLLLVVNAQALKDGYPLTLWTDEGSLDERAFTNSLRAVDKKLQVKRISFSIKGEVGRANLETILLTGYAGRTKCELYPGEVFGMTGAGDRKREKLIARWVDYLQIRPEEPFPTTAISWFESWGRSPGRALAGAEEAVPTEYWECVPGRGNFLTGMKWYIPENQ